MTYLLNVSNYNIKAREKVFSMNLNEDIQRIRQVMGLDETIRVDIRRRLNLEQEYILSTLIKSILKSDTSFDKEKNLNRVFFDLANLLLENLSTSEKVLDYDDNEISEVKRILMDKFYQWASELYDKLFEGTEDNETYCFIKHSERYGGLQSRGFSECINGWHNLLKKYGGWLTKVDWPHVKQTLDNSAPKTKLLLANPEDGHPYHYYFSIVKV